MKTISVAEAGRQLDELLDTLGEGPVLLLRKGQPCAALVGLSEQFDREAFALGRNARLRRLVNEACRKTRESGGISFAEIVAEVDKNSPQSQPGARRPRRQGARGR